MAERTTPRPEAPLEWARLRVLRLGVERPDRAADVAELETERSAPVMPGPSTRTTRREIGSNAARKCPLPFNPRTVRRVGSRPWARKRLRSIGVSARVVTSTSTGGVDPSGVEQWSTAVGPRSTPTPAIIGPSWT
jgi:hypothetical protein